MIYMETILTVHPDKVSAYMEAEKDMYSAIEKYGAKIVGAWQTVIGNANEFTILFAYEDMGQLQKASMAMMQDKGYQATWQRIASLIISHSRKIMLPMPMSQLK